MKDCEDKQQEERMAEIHVEEVARKVKEAEESGMAKVQSEELTALQTEAEDLRQENAKLKEEIAAFKTEIEKLKEQVEQSNTRYIFIFLTLIKDSWIFYSCPTYKYNVVVSIAIGIQQ